MCVCVYIPTQFGVFGIAINERMNHPGIEIEVYQIII
jgi:hypothetical protein